MRRLLLFTILLLVLAVPFATAQRAHQGFAQVTAPQGDEFNFSTFTAPFKVLCGQFATPTCPDPQGPSSWSLNGTRPGFLEIQTQFGSLVGTGAQSSNNARNFVLQPFDPATDFTVTTSMTFPGLATNTTPLGQTAGLLVYQDDDNFIYFGRVLDPAGVVDLQFLQETNGVDVSHTTPETGFSLHPIIYLRLVKQGTLYQAQFSYDNATFISFGAGSPVTPTPTATATATATYAAPKIGVFAWGGRNAGVVAAPVPADFDWFRVGDSAVPAPTPTPTSTPTATATGTPLPTNTPLPTSTPTSTPVPSSTATATATATSTPTSTPLPTNTPIPTPTPKPTPRAASTAFSYTSVWYHVIRMNTVETIQAQAVPRAQQGIWVHVLFASGNHLDYYQNTDKNGFWQTSFKIPTNSVSRYSSEAVVTFQLWHGKATAKSFETFTVIR